MIDPELYLKAAGLDSTRNGGQELILAEVLALLAPYHTIWLPFPEGCITLMGRLREAGHKVVSDVSDDPIDAMYLGTPTIVDGKPLFPETAGRVMTKEAERALVKSLQATATLRGAKRIVTGLGSGDISLGERVEDMGGGRMVVEKRFDEFIDWVIVRDIK